MVLDDFGAGTDDSGFGVGHRAPPILARYAFWRQAPEQ
jgi:hypothetical protein